MSSGTRLGKWRYWAAAAGSQSFTREMFPLSQPYNYSGLRRSTIICDQVRVTVLPSRRKRGSTQALPPPEWSLGANTVNYVNSAGWFLLKHCPVNHFPTNCDKVAAGWNGKRGHGRLPQQISDASGFSPKVCDCPSVCARLLRSHQ